MASGSSQGKPAGVFANGLPSFAALARLTAGHFSSAAHKKAAALNNNNSNNGKNQLQKQHQQQFFEGQQAAASRPLGAQQVGSRASPAGPFSLTQQQQRRHEQNEQHEQHEQHAALQMAGRPNGRAEAASEEEERAAARCYADQLRRGQLHQRLQGAQASAGEQAGAGEQQQRRPPECKQKQQQQQQQQRGVHVNFGLARSSQANALDGDELEGGESGRKKKYLTAKYGAQQMSLIKKRLKIEMWLHERLEELTSSSKALPAGQLDELDIDLDQLLDLEDERARREHLSALLAPLADVPRDSLERFIGEVLEQSKLL